MNPGAATHSCARRRDGHLQARVPVHKTRGHPQLGKQRLSHEAWQVKTCRIRLITKPTVLFKCTEPLTPRCPSTLARTFQPPQNPEMRGCHPESHSGQRWSWETTSPGDGDLGLPSEGAWQGSNRPFTFHGLRFSKARGSVLGIALEPTAVPGRCWGPCSGGMDTAEGWHSPCARDRKPCFPLDAGRG